jgi:hypothetical protein
MKYLGVYLLSFYDLCNELLNLLNISVDERGIF